jgi:hypothetical protein
VTVATKGRSECRKGECHNERGLTPEGLTSLYCPWHIEEARMRLARFQAAHGSADFRETVRVQPVTFTPPSQVMCRGCEENPAAPGDGLCEECRG